MPSPSASTYGYATYELSYDFPVASTSALPSPSASASTSTSSASSASASTSSAQRQRRTRTRSPARRTAPPRWEQAPLDDLDDNADIDYPALGYPAFPPSFHRDTSTRTGNQWRAPSPARAYPYGSDLGYYQAASAYRPPSPLALASSCGSERSALSCERPERRAHKICKPHPHPPSVSSASSSSHDSHSHSPDLDLDNADFEEEGDADEREDADEPRGRPTTKCPAPASTALALRRQWAALSLRVRFGVFRAKRRMRDRVLSL